MKKAVLKNFVVFLVKHIGVTFKVAGLNDWNFIKSDSGPGVFL